MNSKKILLVILSSLLVFACEDKASELSRSNISSTPISSSTSIKILPLGDSITQGGRGFASYRRSLWFLLQDAGYKVDFIGSKKDFNGDVADDLKNFDFDHEGHSGWEAGEINNKLAGSRYFCESLFWASQPKQAAKT